MTGKLAFSTSPMWVLQGVLYYRFWPASSYIIEAGNPVDYIYIGCKVEIHLVENNNF